MRIECLHGFFKFKPERVSDASKLNGLLNANLVKRDDYFTFARLQDAPNYTLKGKLYLDTLSEVTFEGNPWDVMRANKIVFDFASNLSVLTSAVTASVTLNKGRFNFIQDGLIVPGSLTPDGRIISYSCNLREDLRFFYDWVEYE